MARWVLLMSAIFKDDLFWLALLPWAIFIVTDNARRSGPAVVYLCALLAAAGLARAIYRLSKKRELIAWIAAVASLIASVLLWLVIFVVIGLP